MPARPPRLAILAVLSVCAGCADPPAPAGPAPSDSAAPAPVSERGSVVLAFREPSANDAVPTTALAGAFVTEGAPWRHLADCLTSPWGICADAEPTEPDAWLPAVRRSEIDPPLSETLEGREVGPSIEVGGYEAPWRDSGRAIGLYEAAFTGISPTDEAVGVAFSGGAWGSVRRNRILPGPTRLWVTSPNPLDPVEVDDLGPVPLRWAPGRAGELSLLVGTEAGSRVYRLEDDGEHDLDLTDLGLPSGAPVDLVLQRRTTAEIEVFDHRLTLEVASVQPLAGVWSSSADRTPLELPDTCAEAASAPTLSPGSYLGDFTGYRADHDPGAGGCAGFPQIGADAVLPVRIEAWAQVEIAHRLARDDGSVYLLLDCADAASCVAGADDRSPGGTERLVWFNDTGSALTAWLVLDAYGAVTGPSLLDLTVTALSGEVLAETCLEALDNGPVPEGAYDGRLDDHPSGLAPDCIDGAGAGERVAEVEVFPGRTLRAEITAQSGDPQLYLMWNCSVEDSCFAATDERTDGTEVLAWENTAGVVQRVFLVIDAREPVGEVHLDLSVD